MIKSHVSKLRKKRGLKNPERRDFIIDAINRGMSLLEIGNELNIGYHSVWYYAKKNRISLKFDLPRSQYFSRDEMSIEQRWFWHKVCSRYLPRPVKLQIYSKLKDSLPKVCPIFGTPLEYESNPGRSMENSPSLDRIDSSKDYSASNVAIISRRANVTKNSGTAEEHFKIAAWMKSVTVP